MSQNEQVVLVDELDKEIGYESKLSVHHRDTPLHRGVSVFLFNSDKKLLIQKRHVNKIAWGGFWSNSVCGHPLPTESYEQAARRRLKFELGVQKVEIRLISNYRYSFTREDITENEICPIYFAISDDWVIPNLNEISETVLVSWNRFSELLKNLHHLFTPWCLEEAELLRVDPGFAKYISG
jgi:isopentenyl-diphosphate delta-isomerase